MVNDAFGFAYKYNSKPSGETYSLPVDPNTDSRFDAEQEVIPTGEGTYRFENDDRAEFSILTSALFNADNIIDDHGDLDADEGGRGYMMDPKDWRDVEINFHWRVLDWSKDEGFYVTLGGGRHANPQPFCEGCGYVYKVFFNGDITLQKEQWHNHKVFVPFEDSANFPPDVGINYNNGIFEGALTGEPDAWHLMKICRYNVKQNDGKSGVKFEVYYNTSGDKQTWNLLIEILDVAGWGNEGAECNGKPDQVLSWGFPMIRFFWENADRIEWYGLTVREIAPLAAVPQDPGDNTGGGPGGQPTIPPAEIPTGKVSKIGSFRFSIASTLATSCDGTPGEVPAPTPDPPPPDPPGGGSGGVISTKLAEYFHVGS